MKKTIYGVVIAVLLAGAGGLAVYTVTKDEPQPSPSATSQTTEPEQKITFSEDRKTVIYDGEEGKTALETLESLATVTTQDSSFGKMVTGINGRAADPSVEYWSFYVNGQMASEGAGTYRAQPGDRIEWRLEKL